MALNTDLALEAFSEAQSAGSVSGAEARTFFDESAELKITCVDVKTAAAADTLAKPRGRYITIESEMPFYEYSPRFAERVAAVAKQLACVCTAGRTLFVGLGNRRITADSLGPLAADRIFATRHIKRLAREIDTHDLGDTAVISPGVMAQTGVESASLARAVSGVVKPAQLIVCDALACLSPTHMGRTIQLSSSGISPGSGVENSREELSRSTLGVPVAAIGIPTVSRLLSDREGMAELLVTPKPIDKLCEQGSALIAAAVNLYLHPTLTPEEISSLIF